jgi:hypothetical protein
LSPDSVELVVARIVVADLDVHLEDAGAELQRLFHVLRRAGLRVERAARDAARSCCRELPGPGVERRGHVRLVRVDERREAAYAEILQRLESLGHRRAVGDRPGGAVVGARLVEVAPDGVHHAVGEEVHMHVHQPVETEPLPPRRYLVVTHLATLRPAVLAIVT